MDDREIPEILKQLRTRLDMSQEDLAAKLGVAFSTLNRWENGHSIPRG
ncbi:MAG: helix-turn-helix transcriptional regulator, partial [Spirochaetia bacterium]